MNKPTSYNGKHVFFNTILVFIAATILFIGLTQDINVYDEGLAIVGGERVLDGEMPYKDFWTIYAPGQFYLLAGFFSVFGTSILVERILTVLIYISMASFWLSISRRLHFGRSRYIALMVIAAWIAIFPLFGRAIPTALLFCLASGYFLFRFFETKTLKYVVFSGFALGFAALFRHDIAGFLFGAIFQAVFFFSMGDDKVNGLPWHKKAMHGLTKAMYMIFGLLPFLIPFFLLLGTVGFDLLWQNLIYIPYEVFGDYRSLPFPNPITALSAERYPLIRLWEAVLFYVPPIIFTITIIGIIYRTKKKIIKLNGARFWLEITAFNFGVNLLNTAMVRSDLEHTLPAWIGAILCLLVIFDWIRNHYTRGVVTVISLLFIGGYPILKLSNHLLKINNGEKTLSAHRDFFPAAVDTKWAKRYVTTVELIKSKLEDGDYFYSGPTDHTDFVVNDVMIYHLTDTRPSTYFHELHPGISTNLLAQNRIFKQIEEAGPKMLVLTDYGGSDEPNQSSQIKQTDIIRPYIKSRYTKISKFGDYIVYVRDDKVGELPY